MRSLVVMVFALILGFVPNAAFADKSETVSTRGSGTYRDDDGKSKISRIEVEFRDGEKFTMTVTLDDDSTVELRGRYTGDGRRRDLDVRKGLGRDEIKGSGDITLTDNKRGIRKVSVLGRAGGEAYSIEFETDSDQGDHGSGNKFSYSGSASGDGRVRRGDATDGFASVRVRMTKSGDFSITPHGENSDIATWDGEWSGDGPEYRVKLRARGDENLKASGTVRFNKERTRIRSINIEGDINDDRFSLTFNASTNDDDGDSGSAKFPITKSVDVKGTLKRSGDKLSISHVKITMAEDGTFQVTLRGKGVRDEVWKGTWSGEGPEYTVFIPKTDGLNLEASGKITLSKNRRSFVRLDIAGNQNDSPFDLSVRREDES